MIFDPPKSHIPSVAPEGPRLNHQRPNPAWDCWDRSNPQAAHFQKRVTNGKYESSKQKDGGSASLKVWFGVLNDLNGLVGNLEETMVFPIRHRGFRLDFPMVFPIRHVTNSGK